MKKKPKKLKQYSIVVYEPSWYVKVMGSGGAGGGGKPGPSAGGGYMPIVPPKQRPILEYGEQVLYLGEVPNAIGHCAVAKWSGEVVWLVHPQDFREATDEET